MGRRDPGWLSEWPEEARLLYIRYRTVEHRGRAPSLRAVYEKFPNIRRYNTTTIRQYETSNQFAEERDGKWVNRGLATRIERIVALVGLATRLLKLFHETKDSDTPRLKALAEQARFALMDLDKHTVGITADKVDAPIEELAVALAAALKKQNADQTALAKINWEFPGGQSSHERPS